MNFLYFQQVRGLILISLAALAGWQLSPPMALAAGLAGGVLGVHRMWAHTASAAKALLQFSVILLGFSVPLPLIFQLGIPSLGISLLTITAGLSLGWVLTRYWRLEPALGLLLSGGTAICGGSAIAALAPAIGATHAQTSAALAVIFCLNGVALWLFPLIGHGLHLNAAEFGWWGALAIHDTSAVVGATAHFGAQALAIGTTVKLTRALWILPLSLVLAQYYKQQQNTPFPWFLIGFLLAALLRFLLPNWHTLWQWQAQFGQHCLTTSLFLLGSSIGREALRPLNKRALFMALSLWILMAGLTLAGIKAGLMPLSSTI